LAITFARRGAIELLNYSIGKENLENTALPLAITAYVEERSDTEWWPLGQVEFCSDLHSTLKQLDCSEWASRISTNLGLYSCESLISFSEALNSCTYIYEPNRRVLSSGGYRELPRWVFAYVALVGMLCRAPRADPLQSYNTFALRLISEV
jgi:hypothetical protein